MRCPFTYTKGGQSIERGGGQASNIIQRFEERKEKTDINIAHRSDSSVSFKKISSVSSRKISFPNFNNRKLTDSNMLLTPTKRKLISDQNIQSLICNYENTTTNHLRGGWRGVVKSPAKRRRCEILAEVDDLKH